MAGSIRAYVSHRRQRLMTAATTPVASIDLGPARRSGVVPNFASFLRRKPLGAIGAAMLLFMVLFGLLAPVFAPYDPLEFHTSATFQKPSNTFLLGTDDKGRDILSRIMYGAQISLKVGVIAVGIGTTFGLLAGLVSGYLGGKFDFIAQRVVDSFQAFPALFLALAVTTALGRSVWNVGIALAIVTWPTASRVIRSSVLAQKNIAYIEAARSVGAETPR